MLDLVSVIVIFAWQAPLRKVSATLLNLASAAADTDVRCSSTSGYSSTMAWHVQLVTLPDVSITPLYFARTDGGIVDASSKLGRSFSQFN